MGQKKKEATATSYRPGVVEGVLDATVGAGYRQLQRVTGASEKDAYRLSSDMLNRVEQLTGAKATEESIRRLLAGEGRGGDYVTAGLAALPLVGRVPAVRRAVSAADEALLGQRMSNHVVPEPNPAGKDSVLGGRALTRPEQVTFAQRNISTAELADALKHGRFNAPPKGSKHSDTPAKWWSAADDKGVFGRSWAKGEHTVRLPATKVSPNRAASTKHAEVFDPQSKMWVPLSLYAKKYAIGGVVIDDGNPAKQRKLI